jgi:hypothetical protein
VPFFTASLTESAAPWPFEEAATDFPLADLAFEALDLAPAFAFEELDFDPALAFEELDFAALEVPFAFAFGFAFLALLFVSAIASRPFCGPPSPAGGGRV